MVLSCKTNNIDIDESENEDISMTEFPNPVVDNTKWKMENK